MPANLLFFGALIVLLLLSLQLAYESGRLEEETRTLAEEVALLNLRLEQLTADDPSGPVEATEDDLGGDPGGGTGDGLRRDYESAATTRQGQGDAVFDGRTTGASGTTTHDGAARGRGHRHR